MELDREVTVWRLDPVLPADTSDLLRKFALVRPSTYVLNDGIAEHDIEGRILERQHTGIGSKDMDGAR